MLVNSRVAERLVASQGLTELREISSLSRKGVLM
jgi:hypothetical protein